MSAWDAGSAGDVATERSGRDDPLLQLVGALEEFQDPGVAIHLFEPHALAGLADLACEAERSVDLDRVSDDVVGPTARVGSEVNTASTRR